MKVIDLLEAESPYEKMVVSAYKWTKGDYSAFRQEMIAHINDYKGMPDDHEDGEDAFGDWEWGVRHLFENGGIIQRVVFLDSLKDLRISDLGGNTPWTMMDLADNEEFVGYLRSNNEGNGGSGEHAYIFTAKTPPGNIHMGIINLPEEYREEEINVSDINKLTDVTIKMGVNNKFEVVGELDIRNKKIKMAS